MPPKHIKLNLGFGHLAELFHLFRESIIHRAKTAEVGLFGLTRMTLWPASVFIGVDASENSILTFDAGYWISGGRLESSPNYEHV